MRAPIRFTIHSKVTSSRQGFSIMEIMIALGLLSVLMLLGWGMLDSLQRSQERSWKLTQRIRLLRITRSWLSEDMDHLARGPSFGANPNDPGSVPVSFEGDITGFIATVLPSLDPVPFLQRLGDDPNQVEASEVTIESLAATPEEIATQQWKQSIWSGERIDVEYRLEPIYEDETALAEIRDPETIQYEIVRREWIPESYFDQFRAANQPASGLQSSRPLRKGSISDVAKTNPLEAMAAEETEWIPPLKETRLYGVKKPKFQYFDGTQWLSEWSSSVQGGLPKAIAISFDFPPVSEFKKPIPPPQDDQSKESLDKAIELENPLFEAESKALDTRSEMSGLGERLVETSESEYVILVETGRRDAAPSTLPGVGPSMNTAPGLPRGPRPIGGGP